MTKVFLIFGAVLGFLAVSAGAFGAHAMRDRLTERMFSNWNTAAEYQMYHALALFAVAWLSTQVDSTATTVAGWAFVLGVLVFSGSLYLMAFTGAKWLGAITPIGGTAMLVGWASLAVAASKLAS